MARSSPLHPHLPRPPSGQVTPRRLADAVFVLLAGALLGLPFLLLALGGLLYGF